MSSSQVLSEALSIPNKSFDFIKSYALLLIDQERNLVEAGLNL